MASQSVSQFADISDMNAAEVKAEDGYKKLPPGSYYILLIPKKTMDKSLITPLCMRDGSESIKHLRAFSYVVECAQGLMEKLRRGGTPSNNAPPSNSRSVLVVPPLATGRAENSVLNTEEANIINRSVLNAVNSFTSNPPQPSPQSSGTPGSTPQHDYPDANTMFVMPGETSLNSTYVDPSFVNMGDGEDANRDGIGDLVDGIDQMDIGEDERQSDNGYLPSSAIEEVVRESENETDPGRVGTPQAFIVNDVEYIIYILVLPRTIQEEKFHAYISELFSKDPNKGRSKKSKKSDFTLSDCADTFNSYISNILSPDASSIIKKHFSGTSLKPQRTFGLRLAMSIFCENMDLIERLFVPGSDENWRLKLFDPSEVSRNGLFFSPEASIYKVHDCSILVDKRIGHNAFPWVDKTMYEYMKKGANDGSIVDELCNRAHVYYNTSKDSESSTSLSVYHPLAKLEIYHTNINNQFNSDRRMGDKEYRKKIKRLEYALTNSCMRRLFSTNYNNVLKWPEKDFKDSTMIRGFPIHLDHEFVEDFCNEVSQILTKELYCYIDSNKIKNKSLEGVKVRASQLTCHLEYMHEVYLTAYTVLPVILPIIDCLLPGCFNCFSRDKSLHFNVLISGKPSGGKTDAMNVVMDLIIKDTVDRGTDSSDLAYFVDTPIGMDISYVPEAMPHLTDAKPASGADKVKLERIKAVTSDMTNTRNVCITDENTGQRKQKRIVCDWFTSLVVIMNEKQGQHESTPLAARFFSVEIPRSDSDSAANKVAKRFLLSNQPDSESTKKIAQSFMRSIHYLSLQIHAAEDARVIEPPDMTLSVLVVSKLMESMSHLGLEPNRLNEIRNTIRVNLLSKEYCIMNAILEYYRVYKDEYNFFEFEDLMSIEPLLYSRVEQICIAFGLLLSQYTEPVVASMYATICSFFGLNRSTMFGIIGKDSSDPDISRIGRIRGHKASESTIHQYSVALSMLKSGLKSFLLKATGAGGLDNISSQEIKERELYKSYRSGKNLASNEHAVDYVKILDDYYNGLCGDLASEAGDSQRSDGEIPERSSPHTAHQEEEQNDTIPGMEDESNEDNHTEEEEVPLDQAQSPTRMDETENTQERNVNSALYEDEDYALKMSYSVSVRKEFIRGHDIFSEVNDNYILSRKLSEIVNDAKELDELNSDMCSIMDKLSEIDYEGKDTEFTRIDPKSIEEPKKKKKVEQELLVIDDASPVGGEDTGPFEECINNEDITRPPAQEDNTDHEKRNKKTPESDHIRDETSASRMSTSPGQDRPSAALSAEQDEPMRESSTRGRDQDPFDSMYELLKGVCSDRIAQIKGSNQEHSHAHLLDEETLEMIITYAYFYLDRLMCQVHSVKSYQTDNLIEFKMAPAKSVNREEYRTASRSSRFDRETYIRDISQKTDPRQNPENDQNALDCFTYDYNFIGMKVTKFKLLDIASKSTAIPSRHEASNSISILARKTFSPLFSYSLVSGSIHSEIMKMYSSRIEGIPYNLVDRVMALSSKVELKLMPDGGSHTYIVEICQHRDPIAYFLDVRGLLAESQIDLQSLFEENLTYSGLNPKIFTCMDSGSNFVASQNTSKTIVLLPDENKKSFTMKNPIYSSSEKTSKKNIISSGSAAFLAEINSGESLYKTRRQRNESRRLKRKKEMEMAERGDYDGMEGVSISEYSSNLLTRCDSRRKKRDDLFDFLSDNTVENINISIDLDEWSRRLRLKKLGSRYITESNQQDAVKYDSSVIRAKSHNYIEK